MKIPKGPMRLALVAGVLYFATVFVIGFLLGILRVLVLTPIFGEITATILEMPIILGASWIVCRRLVQGLQVPKTTITRWTMGGIAFGLLMIAELVLATIVFDKTVIEYLESFRLPQRLIGLVGQIAFGLFPLVQR